MAILTVHQWRDLDAGLAELRRVTREPVVTLTFDPGARSAGSVRSFVEDGAVSGFERAEGRLGVWPVGRPVGATPHPGLVRRFTSSGDRSRLMVERLTLRRNPLIEEVDAIPCAPKRATATYGPDIPAFPVLGSAALLARMLLPSPELGTARS